MFDTIKPLAGARLPELWIDTLATPFIRLSSTSCYLELRQM